MFVVIEVIKIFLDIIDCNGLGCSSGFCWCNDNTDCCQTCEHANTFNILLVLYDLVSFNCNCNNNRCFRNGPNIQCCNPECAAGCSGGGNSDQCRVNDNYMYVIDLFFIFLHHDRLVRMF